MNPLKRQHVTRLFQIAVVWSLVGACVNWPISQKRDLAAVDIKRPNSDSKDPTYDDLVGILKSNPKISTIQELLNILNQRFPSYFERFTLAYRSRSLHGSSPTHPRALVFGRTARLVLTFNGNVEQDAYDKLEIMRFDDRQKRFEFREIAFKEGRSDVNWNHQVLEPDIISSRPEIRCSSCHGQPSRPIWEPYFTWPGFYGADDDTSYLRYAIENGFVPEHFSSNNVFGVRMYSDPLKRYQQNYSNDREYSKLREFFSSQKNHPRYKYLIEGFLRRARFAGQKFAENSAEDLSPILRPNFMLNRLFSKLNGHRIANEILNDPNMKKFAALDLYFSEACQFLGLKDYDLVVKRWHGNELPDISDEGRQNAIENMKEVAGDFGYDSADFNLQSVDSGGDFLYKLVKSKFGENKVRYWPMTYSRAATFQDGFDGIPFISATSITFSAAVFPRGGNGFYTQHTRDEGSGYEDKIEMSLPTRKGCEYLSQLLLKP